MYRALGFVLVALAAGGCVDLTEPDVLRCDPCTADAHVAQPEPGPDAAAPDAALDAPAAESEPDAPGTVSAADGPGPAGPSDALGALGAACSIAAGCESGFCAQGVCCSTACDAPCYSCALGGTGICSPLPAGGDSLNRCQDLGVASCGTNGMCDGSGHCSLYAAATVCAAGICAAGVETSLRTCDGNGSCNPAVTSNCAPQLCAADACATTCSGPNGCVPGYACTPAGLCLNLANGLLAHWALDEAANAATAIDSSGNGFNAIDVGGTTVSPAPDHPAKYTNPNARRFSRVDDPTSDSLRVVNPGARLRPLNWTISGWFRSTNVDRLGGTIANMGDSYMLIVGPTGGVQSTRRVAGTWFVCPAPGNFLDDRWHHAVGTSTSGGAVTTWVDGVKTSCLNNTGVQTYDLGLDLFMGHHGNGGIDYDFDGSLDDIRIYGRVLDDAEILALFAGQ